MNIEFLWFEGCPSHEAARELLLDVLASHGLPLEFADVNASDPVVAQRVRFPGSPTIRVDGRDVDPGFIEDGDYSPRCRLYWTASGPRGVPERAWVEDAIEARR